jgi:hypothetical protein
VFAILLPMLDPESAFISARNLEAIADGFTRVGLEIPASLPKVDITLSLHNPIKSFHFEINFLSNIKLDVEKSDSISTNWDIFHKKNESSNIRCAITIRQSGIH